jgi:hypothetical protein
MKNGMTIKEKAGGEKNIYDYEREELDKMNKDFSKINMLLF